MTVGHDCIVIMTADNSDDGWRIVKHTDLEPGVKYVFNKHGKV